MNQDEDATQDENERSWMEVHRRAVELGTRLLDLGQSHLIARFAERIPPRAAESILNAETFMDSKWEGVNWDELSTFERLIRSKVPNCEFQTVDLMFIIYVTLGNLDLQRMQAFLVEANLELTLEGVINCYLEYSRAGSLGHLRLSSLEKILRLLAIDIEGQSLESIVKEAMEHKDLLRFEEQLLGNGHEIRSVEQLDALTGQQFEDFLAGLYESRGFSVELTPAPHDQGADLILCKDAVRTVVQAKRYKGSVGNVAVQEIVAAMKYYKADLAKVVTTGSFTMSAIKLAQANAVDLVGRGELQAILKWQSMRSR